MVTEDDSVLLLNILLLQDNIREVEELGLKVNQSNAVVFESNVDFCMMLLSPVPSVKGSEVTLKMCIMAPRRTVTDSASRCGWVMASLCWLSCG